jgi:tetratricopeptide (TPR) repeat protein
MRYTVKWRFLLKLVVVLLVAGAAVFFVHRWQVGRQVGVFLHQADLARDAAEREQQAGNRAQAQAEREREEGYLRRYVMARPDDLDARDRLGRLLVQNARSGRQSAAAFYFLEDVLRRDPERDDLRRLTAELALGRLRYYREAGVHLDVLNRKHPDDGELEGLIALSYAQQREYGEAVKWYEKSKDHKKDLLSSYAGLAVIQRLHLKREKAADATIEDMVKENNQAFRAHLIAAGYWREYGKPEQVEVAVAAARKLAPDELEVLVAAADLARAQARVLARSRNPGERKKAEAAVDKARDLLKQALQPTPQRKAAPPAVYLALALLEAEARQTPKALEVVEQGLAALPDHPDLLLGKLDYQYQAGDAAGAEDTLEKLKGRGLAPDLTDYQHARVLALREQWKDAAPLLVKTIPALADTPRLARQANILLGRCYEQLGEHASRIAPYTDALNRPTPLSSADPLWLPASLGLAETYEALGQTDEALAAYRRMAAAVPAVWVQVARLELARVSPAPRSDKDDPKKWALVEEALAKAEAAGELIPDDLDIKILRATLLDRRGKPAEARRALEELRKDRPKESVVWIELAYQDGREEKFQQGLATLAAAEKELPDSPELRLARAELLVLAKEPDLPARIAALAAGAEKFGVVRQRRLLRGLAEVASRAGIDEVAGRLWDDLARVKPFDLSVHVARFDRAAGAGNVKAMEEILPQIAAIDGENGHTTRLASAVVLIHQSRAGNDRALREALAIVDSLEREKVGSPLAERVLLSQAVIHGMNRNPLAAIEKYREIKRRGKLTAESLGRYIKLLYASDSEENAREAEGLLAELGKPEELSPDFQRIVAEGLLRAGNPRRALDYAVLAVRKDSKNYRDQIWLGLVYRAASATLAPQEKAEPEARFREAVRLAPDATDAWLVLIEYLRDTDRKDEAVKTFEQARDKVKKEDRAVFLAAGHARLGQRDKAVEAYRQARIAAPSEVAPAMLEAVYLLEIGRLAEARAAFNRVIALPAATDADRAAARHRLLLATAADPNYEVARGALELLKDTPTGGPDPNETPAQKRARALILALQKDRASKLEAIRLLEENTKGRAVAELFMLAQLHNIVGNPKRVRVVMADLLKADKNKIPLYTGFYALWLIRQGDPGDLREAEGLIGHLAKTDPDSLQTAELKARLAAARKDLTAAREALRPQIENPAATVGVLWRICEDIGLYDDAERLLKKFVEQTREKQPAVVLAVAAYHGRRGRTAEALKLWEESRAGLPAPVVGDVAVNVLYNGANPAAGDVTKVAAWIEAAAGKARGEERAVLLQQLASVRNLQGDHAGSATLYVQAVAANPRDVLAMNNLAYLLSAKHNKHDEALEWIDRAKKVIGPTNPDLLDTEALILLNKGQPEAARKNLEIVVAEAPSGPAYYHLAQAEYAGKHAREAKAAWRRAHDLGLKRADLHPLEWPAYEALGKELQ